MRMTIYSWDLDVVGGGGWAISMREFAELFSDHGHEVRFIHSRVTYHHERGTPLGGPALDESQWADADVVWIYDGGNSTTEIIEHIAGRKPIVVSWPTPSAGWFELFLRHENVRVLVNSPVIEALVAREGISVRRVKVLPRGRRWSNWPVPSGPHDKVGLPFGLKAPVRGDGSRPGSESDHSPFPRFATNYGAVDATALTPAFNAIDVARGIHEATGTKAIVTTWVPNEFKDAPFVDVRPPIRPHTDMAAFYAECRLFLPSLIWESFGAQALEAQQQGVPLVYLREPDVQEPQLSFSGLGYVTLDQAVEAASRLIRDNEWWRYWCLKSFENAARFDLDHLWPEYEAFFAEAARCQ